MLKTLIIRTSIMDIAPADMLSAVRLALARIVEKLGNLDFSVSHLSK